MAIESSENEIRESSRVSESSVRESVENYLEREGYTKRTIIREFTIGIESRVDLFAYKWYKDGYGIDYFIVECKDSGDLQPRRFTEIIQDQIARYQQIYPRIYVAIPEPSNSLPDRSFYRYSL